MSNIKISCWCNETALISTAGEMGGESKHRRAINSHSKFKTPSTAFSPLMQMKHQNHLFLWTNYSSQTCMHRTSVKTLELSWKHGPQGELLNKHDCRVSESNISVIKKHSRWIERKQKGISAQPSAGHWFPKSSVIVCWEQFSVCPYAIIIYCRHGPAHR